MKNRKLTGCLGIGCLGIIGLVTLLLIIGGIGAALSGDDSPEPTQEPTTSATPAPEHTKAEESQAPAVDDPPTPARVETKEPAPTENAPADPMTALADDSGVTGAAATLDPTGNLFVTFPASEGFSGVSKSMAQKDTVDILEAVQASELDYQKVHVQGTLNGSIAVNAGYDRATVDGLDFDTVVVPKIWDVRDSGPGLIER